MSPLYANLRPMTQLIVQLKLYHKSTTNPSSIAVHADNEQELENKLHRI